MPDTKTATVKLNGTNVNTTPGKIQVDKAGTNEDIRIVWTADGGTFPQNNFFHWKPGSPTPGKMPTRNSDGTQLTLDYTAPATPAKWLYKVCLENAAGGTFCEDPEIDNTRPGGGAGDELPGKGKGRDKEED